jgi:uncharacterized protein (TIGR03066 family)
MNVLRLLVAVAVACALTVGARADEKKADNAKLLVGTWEVVKADKGTVPVGSTVEFTKDGKMIVIHKQDGKEEKGEGTYKLDGDKFSFEMKMGDKVAKKTITIKKISETEMTTTDEDGKTVEFKRKK